MKHVGTYGGKPCVVVFREVPNETDQCLIVESSSLEDVKHDDLMNVVQSLESQQGKDLSEVLARRQFTDGSNMLNDLHFTKKIIKVPVNMVKDFERKYIDFLNAKHKKTMETIKSGKLTDEVISVLTKAADELSSTY